MAEIKMSYIFIEKQKNESKAMQEILLEVIDDAVQERTSDVIIVNDVEIEYRIIQKKNSERCFLEMSSTERVNKAIGALQVVDDAIFKSSQQKYYHSIRDYDGISESNCKRLYPKYAEFERKLRSLVLFILTKAYGSNWRTETVSEDLLSVLKENAHGKLSLNETLENMDLATLEAYLFEEREVNYLSIINEQLDTNSLSKLSKEEICKIIEGMRPTSLWERHFSKFGSQDSWKSRILEIHQTRDDVAHQKTISINTFTTINKKLNALNRDLTSAIEGIREENFTEYGVVDILGSFATLIGQKMRDTFLSQSFKDVIIGFNAKVQEIVKPMIDVYNSGITEALGSVAKSYMDIGLGIDQLEMVKSMSGLAEQFAITSSITEKLIAKNLVGDCFTTPQIVAQKISSMESLTNPLSFYSSAKMLDEEEE